MNLYLIVAEVKDKINSKYSNIQQNGTRTATQEEKRVAHDLFELLVSFVEEAPATECYETLDRDDDVDGDECSEEEDYSDIKKEFSLETMEKIAKLYHEGRKPKSLFKIAHPT